MKKVSISRYVSSPGDENQFEAGSDRRVLKNLLGIRSKRDMDQLEFESLAAAQEQLVETITGDQKITIDMIRTVHRLIFGAIYSWAGEYRGVELAKSGFSWPPAKFVAQSMQALDDVLQRLTPVRGDIETVANALAVIHGELLFIHPFRDGNGRVARVVSTIMALQAGFPPPHYRFEGRGSRGQKIRYIAALQQAYIQNYAPLTSFFAEALEDFTGPDSE